MRSRPLFVTTCLILLLVLIPLLVQVVRSSITIRDRLPRHHLAASTIDSASASASEPGVIELPPPVPTPTIGCSTCTEVPLLELDKELPPNKLKLWEVLKESGAKAEVSVEFTSRGTSIITLNFKKMANAPAGSKYVVWTLNPQREPVAIGELPKAGQELDVTITKELALKEFGLFVTLERADKRIDLMGLASLPSEVIVGLAEKNRLQRQ